MSAQAKSKGLDVTKLVNDIYFTKEKCTIVMVKAKVSKWLAAKGESKSNLGYEIYDLISMLDLCDFKPDTVESITYEDKECFVNKAVDFSLTLKDKSRWFIEVVGVHPMIQSDYEEFNEEILKNFKDPIIISDNYDAYYQKPRDKGSSAEKYNHNCMRLNFWQNYFEYFQIYIKDAQSKLIDLCKEDAKKVRDYVTESSNKIIGQLDEIISSDIKDVSRIQRELIKVLRKLEHPIISRDLDCSLENYCKYIYKQIKSKFDDHYKLKEGYEKSQRILLVSVQISTFTEDEEIKEAVEKYLLKEINCNLCSKEYKFFQEIYILGQSLIKLQKDVSGFYKILY